MPTLTVYPDAHVETTSVDGRVGQSEKLSWANLRTAAGNSAVDYSATTDIVVIRADEVTNYWDYLIRSIFLFDTSALPDGCRISSAVFSIHGNSKSNTLGLSGTDFKINVYASDPASNIALVTGDFDSLAAVALCDTPITYDDFDITGYNNFTLNAAGLALISKTGITKFGIREVTFDVSGTTPTWASGHEVTVLNAYFAEQGGGNRPRLVITYTGIYPTPGSGDLAGLTRVSSIRHIFRPGFFKMQAGLGDLGFDIDVAEASIRRILDTAEEIVPEPPYPPEEPPVVGGPYEVAPGGIGRPPFEPPTPPPPTAPAVPGAPEPTPTITGGGIIGGISDIPGIEEYRAQKLAERLEAEGGRQRVGRVRCPYCRKFIQPALLSYHIKTVHPGETAPGL